MTPLTATRADRLADRVAEREIDVLLVAEPADLRWVSGYTGSNGVALVGPATRAFLTDFRYVTQAAEQVPDFDRHLGESDLLGNVADLLPDGDVRLGFDQDSLTVKAHERLREVLPDRVELVAVGGPVRELRMVKDPDEQERIRAAAALASDALETVLTRGLAGRTERAIALDLEFEMRRRGAEAISFPPIVAAAEHGALPHAEPRDVEVPRDVLVTIDWGCRLDGYCSDCTRTYATGTVSDEAREVYELVYRAQAESLAAIRAGRTGRELDAVARDIIAAAGHGDHFGHGLGHGVGLEVHEGPRLSKLYPGEIEAGSVVTVEPGVYLPGRLGVRIEDLAIVTAEGTDVLTHLSKELTEVSG
jgi:Xaa-Pro aminopeptidase